MSKNKEIKFVGQPIFKQIVNLVDAVNIESLVRKHKQRLLLQGIQEQDTPDHDAVWYTEPL